MKSTKAQPQRGSLNFMKFIFYDLLVMLIVKTRQKGHQTCNRQLLANIFPQKGHDQVPVEQRASK
jgi:hypothetical protein